MLFRTEVNIPKSDFKIMPCERMLFVGSCFADSIGKRFIAEKFRAVVNPFGVMYNPASVMHSVAKLNAGGLRFEVSGLRFSLTESKLINENPQMEVKSKPQTSNLKPEPSNLNGASPNLKPQTSNLKCEAFRFATFTLGTNHVYILRSTGEIVDNCRKRPQKLFEERELTIAQCVDYLARAVELLMTENPQIKIILTVSPIRYQKYGFHESQLSKATLLLAANELVKRYPANVVYFPAYEIVNDELRDYRFYAPDMLHPSEQAVEYIWQRFADTFFPDETIEFLRQWKPIKEALAHKPFNPDSEEYKAFLAKTIDDAHKLQEKYPNLELDF